MRTVVLIRHGQSEWNKKNLFTGWSDVDLSSEGEREAHRAGLKLKERGLNFNCAFSSVLKRAIRTMELVLKSMGLSTIPTHKAWQLNERHYGALQGQDRLLSIKKYGKEQIFKWRRGFDTPPPPLQMRQNLPSHLYKGLKKAPLSESLKDTQARVLPFWKSQILPLVLSGKTVLLTAHGNSLRSLVKELEGLSDEDISTVEIKTASPLIYQLDEKAGIVSKEAF